MYALLNYVIEGPNEVVYLYLFRYKCYCLVFTPHKTKDFAIVVKSNVVTVLKDKIRLLLTTRWKPQTIDPNIAYNGFNLSLIIRLIQLLGKTSYTVCSFKIFTYLFQAIAIFSISSVIGRRNYSLNESRIDYF